MARWNLDPVLLAALATIWSLYMLFARRTASRPWAFHIGWALTALLLVCPLCPLSVALFSARVAQHMSLTMVAAPLVVLGLPDRSAGPGLGRSPVAAAAVFAVALGYWHAPEPYTVTFESTPAYWLMHLSLFGSALWLWRTLFQAGVRRIAQAVLASAITAGAMGLLGAIITFSARPLYPPHAVTTFPWGLTPLQDQQLGGAVMWAPAGLILVGALLVSLALTLRRAEQAAFGQVAAGGL
jgi:putative membrane protein